MQKASRIRRGGMICSSKHISPNYVAEQTSKLLEASLWFNIAKIQTDELSLKVSHIKFKENIYVQWSKH
jgi:hypothetical protein